MKTGKTSVKQAWPRNFLKNTLEALKPAEPGSPQAAAEKQQDENVINHAVLTALHMAGLGLMAGGGFRLAQEGLRRFAGKPTNVDESREVALEIHKPREKTSATKQALEDVHDWPGYYPLLFGGTGLGLYGGYEGMRALSDMLKKKEQDSELEQARKDFEDALDEQYTASRRKFAGLNAAIDTAYEKWLNEPEPATKQAGVLSTVEGLGIGTAALVWLLSHKAAYSRMHSTDPEAFRKKVLERQRRIRNAVSPAPITFDLPALGFDDEEPDTEKEAAEKIPGGKAEGMSDEDIAKLHDVPVQQIKDQSKLGDKVELEHTDDPEVAHEIDKDHLVEDPEYYDPHLSHMEGEAKQKLDVAGPKPLRQEPTTADVKSILDFISSSDDLDDSAVHDEMYTQGLAPSEGEEIVYSVLQDLLKNHKDEVDPKRVEEKEPESADPGDEEELTPAKAEADAEEKGKDKLKEKEDAEKKASAEHSCSVCANFDGGKCKKQDQVIKDVGEDNLTIYLSNATKTNSCPVFEQQDESIDPAVPVVGDVLKEAGVMDWLKDTASGVGNAFAESYISKPEVQKQMLDATAQASKSSGTLVPAAQAMKASPEFQEGVNEGALQQAKQVPIIGGMFGG